MTKVITIKNFDIDLLVGEGEQATLRFVDVMENEKGEMAKVDGAKWETISDLSVARGQYGPFLINPLEEDDRANIDTYFISASNPEKRHGKYPAATLRVRRAGQEEVTHICGLFLKQYDDGSYALTGVDKEAKVKYGVFVNAIKGATKLAVNQ